MPKKNRNASRQQQQSPYTDTPLSSSPAFQDTPDIPQRNLDDVSPPFGGLRVTGDDRADVASDGDGYGQLLDVEGTYGRVRRVEVEERPSPLSLSPVPPVPVTEDLVDTSAPASTTQPDVGHTRSPVLISEPGMLASLSATVRDYVPSSLAIAGAIPTPPRVSHKGAFGFFSTGEAHIPPTRQGAYSPPSIPEATSRRWSGAYGQTSQWNGGNRTVPNDDLVSELDLGEDPAGAYGLNHPSNQFDGDEVLWADWDYIEEVGSRSRRLLLLGYESGLQVWDCTDLGSIKEVLNLSSSLGAVTCARVLPVPRATEDSFARERPLLGLIVDNGTGPAFMVYSLASHCIIKTLDVHNPSTFSVNSQFMIISTFSAPSLHIISTHTLATLYTVPSSAIVPFILTTTDKQPVLSTQLESSGVLPPPPSHPEPVFALSGRLLAFAAHPPTSNSPASRGPPTAPAGAINIGNVTQADLGAAALKVGGSLLGGMRALGGFALSAARSRMSGELNTPAQRPQYASKSAPAASGYASPVPPGMSTPARRGSLVPVPTSGIESVGSAAPHVTVVSGHYVRVLDLAGLLVGRNAPETLIQFAAAREPITRLNFTADGTSIIVAHKDGQVTKIFKLQPTASASLHARRRAAAEGDAAPPTSEGSISVYDLRRGRTAGVIERVQGDRDGRWIALGTRNRTVHVFAVNPYGGRTDERSHLEGRVRNPVDIQPISTDISPIARLRSRRPPGAEYRPPAALAFTFVDMESPLPSALLPPIASFTTPQSPPRSLPPSPAQVPLSSPSPTSRSKRARNHQDILLFDPLDGSLSLRRITLEQRTPREIGALPIPLGASMSLPSAGALARMGSSPPAKPASGLSQMMERPAELVGRDAVLAKWNLKRGREWKEVKHILVKKSGVSGEHTIKVERANWIAQAELSTSTRSARLLPRTVYLVHQFSFYAFVEDYHALIRRLQLDVPTTKIDVRRQIEISAYPSGGSEAFMHGGSAPRDIRGATISTSFEEPLSSAISGGLEYSTPGTPVLPMLPNGTPGSYKGIRGARPIRTLAAGIGEGVTEGIGRLRRSVRSPRMGATGTPTEPGVPLEFDEADEDFSTLSPGGEEPMRPSISQDTAEDVRRPVTPAHDDAAPVIDVVGEEGTWSAWDADDQQAVIDQERFDDIGVVGFMDEEQQPQPVTTVSKATGGEGKKKKKGRK